MVIQPPGPNTEPSMQYALHTIHANIIYIHVSEHHQSVCASLCTFDYKAPSIPPPHLLHRMQKALRDLNRQIDAASNAQNSVWEPSQLVQIDRALGEMTRTLNSGTGEDWLCFCQLGGIASVMRMLVVCMVEPLACAGSSGGGHNIRRRVLPEK